MVDNTPPRAPLCATTKRATGAQELSSAARVDAGRDENRSPREKRDRPIQSLPDSAESDDENLWHGGRVS